MYLANPYKIAYKLLRIYTRDTDKRTVKIGQLLLGVDRQHMSALDSKVKSELVKCNKNGDLSKSCT